MLEQKILKTIKKYELIKNGDNIVVGVSGGPDSMALLNALINIRKSSNLKFGITVAHINHMIRIEAEEETKYVQNFCNKNNIECFIKKEQVEEIAKTEKIGTEEAGRKVRYSFFDEVAKKVNANKIATAHNANDNAETVLMNIIRGSGTSGLKGIEPIRENKYIRALIECTRVEIEEYCEEQNLEPKIDKSNMENIYTRNKVRNLLIPYIKENFNPNIITSLNRLSNLASNENEFIQKKVEESYKEVLIKEMLGDKELQGKKEIIIDLKKFNKLDLVIKNRLMLYTIVRVLGTSKNIEKVHIEDLVKLCSNNIGNKYLTPNKNIKVMVNNGKVYFKQL
ncbi:MAG: tRNA lysidine(34) synthetase TilS [Clostridia bacterium]|nr:tRNA lysidine(34) synthetase TilS [Clostridia bacterium]